MKTTAPRAEKIAWAAGLFEGEGSISSDGRTLVLQLRNTDKSVIDDFCEVIRFGTIYGPYTRERAPDGYTRRPVWVWVARNEDAFEGVQMLASWLSARRLDQAEKLTGLRFPVKTGRV